ncbi:3-hydroxyisobutyrate dehydrogenase [Mucilaginibacter frigoritolerans]|uniref:3-hydroxyisobutyrate dehydrogenase n=1 Tax=Mucilaginibacter frigoritolerans TaxID=652788 RepID=A0A562U859_9SPHI|nr:NAD(P)-dependent oxidoreductase [Mucilaginibacter frigoritolerans]TWJ01617.1 3-hydroxyisobutyrate dehydrogenase [Mucilaginibacter frigoritolerans]
MSITKTGWIGLGKMGIPMSQQLIKAGYAVTVYNRSTDKEETLKAMGAATASSPQKLIQDTDAVVIMVSDDAAITSIFSGENGLLSAKVSGKIIINMSTVSPAISKQMADLCEQQGNYYLDAPVSGSVKQAEEGTLVIMVGGDEKAFEQAKPVLEKIGKLTILVGDTGAGNKAKLVINTLLGVYSQGLAEAVLFAEKNGIKTEDLITLLNNGAMGSPYIKIKGDAIIKDNYTAAFALKHIAKDLRLAKDIGLSTPLGKVTYQTFQDAEAKLGNEDIIAVIKQVRG